MPMYFFLLLIVSLSCGSLPPSELDLGRVLFASSGMIAAWWILGHMAARIASNEVLTGQCDAFAGARALERQLDVLRWLGLGVAVFCLAGFGLGRVLDSIPIVSSSMLLQALVLLAPGTLITAGTWSAEHHYGVRMKYADPGLGGYVRAILSGLRQNALWLLAPVLVLITIADGVHHLPVSPALANWIIATVVLAGVTLGLPWMVRYLFKTRPMQPAEMTWTAGLLHAVGIDRTRIICWDTGGRNFNAMVAGFVPPLRTLLISDRLINEMPRDELAMVVLHEAAHVKRRHVPLRMLSVLPAWIAATLVTNIAGDAAWAMPLGTAAGILLTMLILKSVAHRTEHDADWHACQLAEIAAASVDGVPATAAAAAESLNRALVRVTMDHPAARGTTWLHPGIDQRADFLRERIQPSANSTAAATIANPA